MRNSDNIDVEEYIGLPYKVCGRDRKGIDCYGLLVLIYKERLNITLPFATYDDPYGKEAREMLYRGRTKWKRVPREEARPYDVVLFNMYGLPNHIGMVYKPKWMIHCVEGLETCREDYTRPLWASRLEGVYRYA